MKGAGSLIQAIDEGLLVIGEGPRNAVYELLEADYQMRKEEIPTRFVEFSKVLRDNMGPTIEPLLEFIIEGFYLKLQLEPPKWTNLNEGIQTIVETLHQNPTEKTISHAEKTVQ
jgi:hypothetical protein